jgi:hypothetical protein
VCCPLAAAVIIARHQAATVATHRENARADGDGTHTHIPDDYWHS